MLAIGSRIIDRSTLLGTWFDVETNLLIRRGEWKFADGRVLIDPPLGETDGNIIQCREPIRDPNVGGDLAYAFSTPIDGLDVWPSEIQPLFDAIMAVVIPNAAEAEIRDWHSADLPRVLSSFSGGHRGWGMFLFSIYLPALRRLTIVSGAPWD